MKHFASYGPVNKKQHYVAPRLSLVARCLRNLVGEDGERGHYFTIHAPRQTGKTWLMRQVTERVEKEYPGRFKVVTLSMQSIGVDEQAQVSEFFTRLSSAIKHWAGIQVELRSWDDFSSLFYPGSQLTDRPSLLLIDEFDRLPKQILDQVVEQFRDLYLNPFPHYLHGLALIGVRAVLGVDSARGSPFNIQRSLEVPRLTQAEVEDLFVQYEQDRGQRVEPEVVQALFDATRGQPGLVGWLGELLTDKYNEHPDKPIGLPLWERIYRRACTSESSNNILNLVAKARGKHTDQVLELFAHSDIPFVIDAPWCEYLYYNGIIDLVTDLNENMVELEVCRSSSPLVQKRLFHALAQDLYEGLRMPQALRPTDGLKDVFTPEGLNIPRLLDRYFDYLQRLRATGIDPWKGQPRRDDLRHTEAVGHFHLYHWLSQAVGREVLISPEFPTGNGKVDLRLVWQRKPALIEVKSFMNLRQMDAAKVQCYVCAFQQKLPDITLVVFRPQLEKEELEVLASTEIIDGVTVKTIPIPWGSE